MYLFYPFVYVFIKALILFVCNAPQILCHWTTSLATPLTKECDIADLASTGFRPSGVKLRRYWDCSSIRWNQSRPHSTNISLKTTIVPTFTESSWTDTAQRSGSPRKRFCRKRDGARGTHAQDLCGFQGNVLVSIPHIFKVFRLERHGWGKQIKGCFLSSRYTSRF